MTNIFDILQSLSFYYILTWFLFLCMYIFYFYQAWELFHHAFCHYKICLGDHFFSVRPITSFWTAWCSTVSICYSFLVLFVCLSVFLLLGNLFIICYCFISWVELWIYGCWLHNELNIHQLKEGEEVKKTGGQVTWVSFCVCDSFSWALWLIA